MSGARMRFDITQAKSTAKSLKNRAERINNVYKDFSRSFDQLSWWKGSSKNGYNRRMQEALAMLKKAAETIGELGNDLDSVANQQQQLEQQLVKRLLGIPTNVALPVGAVSAVLDKGFREELTAKWNGFGLFSSGSVSYKSSWGDPENGYGVYNTEAKMELSNESKWESDKKKYGTENDDNPKLYDYDSDPTLSFAKEKGTVYGKEFSGSVNTSLWGAGVSGGSEYLNGSIGMDVLKSEASASVGGGLYMMGKDGQEYLNPRVAAKAGASFSILEADAQGQLGNEMFGLNAKGSVAVGKVDAQVGIAAGILDENGKFNPELHASGSIEANAFEATGKVSANVLGGEVGVKGTFKVGIGANFDAGYTDGKFKLEVGATLGIGGSVGIEVDIGGMVDTVCGVAGSVVDWVGGLFR